MDKEKKLSEINYAKLRDEYRKRFTPTAEEGVEGEPLLAEKLPEGVTVSLDPPADLAKFLNGFTVPMPGEDEEAALQARLEDARKREKQRDKEATDARLACKEKGHVWWQDYTCDDGERICRRCGVEGTVEIVERRQDRKLDDKVDVVETKDVWCYICDGRFRVKGSHEGRYICDYCNEANP